MENRKRVGTAVTFPERMTYYDDDDGMEILRRIARRRGLHTATALRQLVREEAARLGWALPGDADEKEKVG